MYRTCVLTVVVVTLALLGAGQVRAQDWVPYQPPYARWPADLWFGINGTQEALRIPVFYTASRVTVENNGADRYTSFRLEGSGGDLQVYAENTIHQTWDSTNQRWDWGDDFYDVIRIVNIQTDNTYVLYNRWANNFYVFDRTDMDPQPYAVWARSNVVPNGD